MPAYNGETGKPRFYSGKLNGGHQRLMVQHPHEGIFYESPALTAELQALLTDNKQLTEAHIRRKMIRNPFW